MDTAALNSRLSELLKVKGAEDLASELDPNFRDYDRPPYPEDDELDSGIAGPDSPDLDPDFSRPSQGLDHEDDPAFSQMPLPDDFTVDNLTEVTKAEYAQWELLAQFPYLISRAIKLTLIQGKDMSHEQRYQVLHDAKVYLVKALEFYDRARKPYLFTEQGYIKGTSLGVMSCCTEVNQASKHAGAVRLAFARTNQYISALLAPQCDSRREAGAIWGLTVANLEAMLKAVEDGMTAIIKGRNREEIMKGG